MSDQDLSASENFTTMDIEAAAIALHRAGWVVVGDEPDDHPGWFELSADSRAKFCGKAIAVLSAVAACRAVPADIDQVTWLEGERLRLLSRTNALWGSLSTAWGQIDRSIKRIHADMDGPGESDVVVLREDLLDIFNHGRREDV